MISTKWRPWLALALVIVGLGVNRRTAEAQSSATLQATGDGLAPLTLSAERLKALPRASVTRMERDREARYEGVRLAEVLRAAGVPLETPMGRGAIGTYIVAIAKDGYQVVFSLGEVDPGLGASEILVADTVNGGPLPADDGPLRLIVKNDKGGARSARMLERIHVAKAPPVR